MSRARMLDAAAGPGHVVRSLERRVAAGCGLAAAALGVLALVGWAAGFPLLTRFAASYQPMSPVVGVLLLLLGLALARIALGSLGPRGRVVQALLIALVALFALLDLIASAVGVDVNGDDALARSLTRLLSIPVRPVPPSTSCFVLLVGCALLALLAEPVERRRRPRFGEAAGVLSAVTGLAALVVGLGYLSGAPVLYGTAAVPIAANTALALLLLSLGAMAAAGQDRWPLRELVGDSARAQLLRVFVPFTMLAVLCTLAVERRLAGLRDPGHVVVATLLLVFVVAAGLIASRLASLLGGAMDAARLAQRQAEEALRWQAGLLDVSYEAIFAWELGGPIISWNRGAEELYGYRREEAIGHISHDLLKTLYPGGQEVLLAALTRDTLWTGEVVHTTKAGRAITVETRQQLIDDASGRRIVLETNRDVTERKRAAGLLEEQVRLRTRELAATNEALTREVSERRRTEEELRATSVYARSLIEASPDPLVTISPEGRITDVNEATLEATGRPRPALIGTDFSDYFTEPGKAREGYQRVFAEGFVTDYPLTIRHRDGRLMYVLYNASLYRDVQGNVLGVFAAARDVTAQQQAAQYARSLIEASLDPLVTISPEGRITDVNEATVKVTGVSRERLIGTDFSDYFTEPEQARAGYRQVFSEGFVVDYPLTVRRRDGTLTDVLYNASVYRDVQGAVLGVFAAARDVTERKRAEEEVRRLNEELEQRVAQRTAELTAANRELEAFTYSVSHDLRTPLRAMDGFSMALLEDYGDRLDGEAAGYLARIRAASQRMAQLIDDLLQLSRVTRSEMRHAPVDISALARTAAAELRETEPARQVSVTIADGLRAEGDPRLLQLVLRNLLANAWKFTSKHPAAHIEVGLAARDGKPAFFVRDDGAGFDMTYVGKLFGVFQRLHGREDFEGTGIGLATVQRIVHRHGGEVWAEGAREQGATFYFTLPRMSS